MKSLKDGCVKVSKDNDLTKVGRLGRNAQVSEVMAFELKLNYARICGKIGVRNGLGNYSDSDDSDGKDLEVYDGFAGDLDLTVINVEQTAAVYMNKYILRSILY